MRSIILAVALSAAVPALAEPPATKSCVRLNQINGQRITDDRTIFYKEGRRWFRNDLRAGCPGLAPNRSLKSRVPSPSLCAGDSVTVSNSQTGFEYGTCGLGEFTAVDGPAPEARR